MSSPIGIFDSGYGGLTILDGIRSRLPQYDYIYLGDNARAPYGTRSFDIVYEFTLQAVKKLFPPEFINRVDEKVYFNSLTRADLEKIIDLEIRDLKTRVEEAGYRLSVTPSAKEFVADAGYDPASRRTR